MTPPSSWFDSKMAYTTDEMYAGDGCHPDEAQALSDYLRGNLTEPEAAKRITAAIINEKSPSQETYRLWGLLSEALVELSDRDRQKTLDLLAEIRTLPPTSDVQWAQLPEFGSMWYDLYKSHLHGGCGIGIFDPEHQDELRRTYEAAGRAEAEMLIRDFGVVDEQRGYLTLNQVCSDGPEIEILISEVFGWLDVAGWKLKERAMSETTVRKYTRSLDGDYRKKHTVEGTLAEHWAVWEERLWKISQGETGLSTIAKDLAARCHELM